MSELPKRRVLLVPVSGKTRDFVEAVARGARGGQTPLRRMLGSGDFEALAADVEAIERDDYFIAVDLASLEVAVADDGGLDLVQVDGAWLPPAASAEL